MGRQERRRMQFWSAMHRHGQRASEHQPDRLTDFPWTEADAMYLLLVRRADQLRACRGDPVYEEEIDGLWNAIDGYEARHPPKAA